LQENAIMRAVSFSHGQNPASAQLRQRGSGGCRRQYAVADSVVNLFLFAIPGQPGADIAAIEAD